MTIRPIFTYGTTRSQVPKDWPEEEKCLFRWRRSTRGVEGRQLKNQNSLCEGLRELDSKWWMVRLFTMPLKSFFSMRYILLLGCLSACTGSARSIYTEPAAVVSIDSEVVSEAIEDLSLNVLPEIPLIRGKAAIRVQYPAPNALLGTDSIFVFGTTGSGEAELFINNRSYEVAPNGAFLAWLKTPEGPDASLSFTALIKGSDGSVSDSATHVLRIRRPSAASTFSSANGIVDTLSFQPRGERFLRADEMVRISFRALTGSVAWIRYPDGKLISIRPSGASASPSGGVLFAGDVRADLLAQGLRLVVARGADTVSVIHPARPVINDPLSPPIYAELRSRTQGLVAESIEDQYVIAKPVPDGYYKWSLLPGTQLQITGRQGDHTRVRLDSCLEAWVNTSDLVTLPEGTLSGTKVGSNFRVSTYAEWDDLVIRTGSKPAFLVEPDGKKLVMTLYGTRFSPGISVLPSSGSNVTQVSWDQVGNDRTILEARLNSDVYGWFVFWDDTRSSLILRIRKPPKIDRENPLKGLVIAVDAGHPPGGAVGPTGLTEAEAVLPVAIRLQKLLEDRGAKVVMTRSSSETVSLTDRPVISRRANAHAFISVHLNAFGDGTNPYDNHGTSTLFFHQHSESLARYVQRAMMQRIGLRDIGIHYQNLAVARATWYPSVLAEGLFMMFPDQENAIKTEDWQHRYAQALADGLSDWFMHLSEGHGAHSSSR